MIDGFVVFDKAIAVNNGDSYLILLVWPMGISIAFYDLDD